MRGWYSKGEHNISHFSRKGANTEQCVDLFEGTLTRHRRVNRALGWEWSSFSSELPNELWAWDKSFLNICGARQVSSDVFHIHYVSCLHDPSTKCLGILSPSPFYGWGTWESGGDMPKHMRLINGRTGAKMTLVWAPVQCCCHQVRLLAEVLNGQFWVTPQIQSASCVTRKHLLVGAVESGG